MKRLITTLFLGLLSCSLWAMEQDLKNPKSLKDLALNEISNQIERGIEENIKNSPTNLDTIHKEIQTAFFDKLPHELQNKLDLLFTSNITPSCMKQIKNIKTHTISNNGNLIAYVLNDSPSIVHFYDTNTNEEFYFDTQIIIQQLELSPAATFLILNYHIAELENMQLWNIPTKSRTKELEECFRPNDTMTGFFSSDDSFLVLLHDKDENKNYNVQIIDTQSLQVIKELEKSNEYEIHGILISPDNKKLLYYYTKNEQLSTDIVSLDDYRTYTVQSSFTKNLDYGRLLDIKCNFSVFLISHDSNWAVFFQSIYTDDLFNSNSISINIIDLKNNTLYKTITLQVDNSELIGQFSPNGKYFGINGNNTSFYLYDTNDWNLIHETPLTGYNFFEKKDNRTHLQLHNKSIFFTTDNVFAGIKGKNEVKLIDLTDNFRQYYFIKNENNDQFFYSFIGKNINNFFTVKDGKQGKILSIWHRR